MSLKKTLFSEFLGFLNSKDIDLYDHITFNLLTLCLRSDDSFFIRHIQLQH